MSSSSVVFLSLSLFTSFLIFFLRGNNAHNDAVDLVFTSPRKIRMLLQTQKSVAQTIAEYIASEKNRLQEIQEYVQKWKEEHEIRAKDKLKYLSNPYNKYHLIKKLTLDWQRITDKMKENNASTFLDNLFGMNELLWPSKSDWEGVQDSLLNIQLINRYKAADLSNGKIGPLTTNVHLTFEECLTLMRRSEFNYNYNLTLEWAAASVLKFFSTPHANDQHLTDVVRANLLSNIIEANFTNAEHYLNIYSMLKPDNSQEIKNLHNLILRRSPTPSAQTISIREKFERMSILCSKPSSIFHGGDLRCEYNNKNSPFLLIAPLKQELISSEPRIIIFRDVLSDSEIKKFMKEGQLRIFKEKKTSDKSSKITFENRFNEVEFIGDDEFKQVSALTRRARDMTGLHQNSVQPWQITLYGVGGFFYEHSDVNLASADEVKNYGRRVASISIALNNVDTGGATVFPQIGLKVDPQKGDAVVWFNLLKDGTEDDRVQHAACPVVMGYKWELIKRINETYP